jgi:hypothetical protein
MSEPIVSKAQPDSPPEHPSLLAIIRGAVDSRDFAIRIMTAAVGALALGWLGPRAALLGLILSPLLGDVIKDLVTTRRWSLRRIWLVAALALLFDFAKQLRTSRKPRPQRSAHVPVATPLVSTLAATVVVLGAFTAADVANGQSVLNHRHTTFFGGRTHRAVAPSLRLPDGRLATSTASLAFRNIRVGSSSAPESLVLSSGSQELRKLRIDASPSTFRLDNGCAGRMPANTSCSVTVVFQPNHAGHVEGRLTISFVSDPELRLELVGTAVPAGVRAATLARARVAFGRIRVGSSTEQTLALRAGSERVSILQIGTDSKEFVAAGCTGRLAAGTSCIIHVRFRPARPGRRSATLTVVSASGARLTTNLDGVGTQAPTQPALVPPNADFGNVQVGATSTPERFTLTAGSSALAVGTPSASSDFRIAANGCPARLAASKSCTIDVTFEPGATGDRSGSLGVASFTAKLHGAGTSAAEPTLTPSRFDFGTQQVGTGSTPVEFTLIAGSTPLSSVGASTASSDYAIASNSCGTQLRAHASCKIAVVFAPQTAGSRTATLTVAGVTASLAGAGAETPPKLAPDPGVFPSVRVGASSLPTAFTLSAGSSALRIGKPTIASSKDYVVASTDCPAQLAATHSCTIAVTFTPLADGAQTATLVVARTDGGPPLTATLTGVGIAVPATLAPTRYDFGSLMVGATLKSTVFTLTAGSSAFPYVTPSTASKDYRVTGSTCTASVAPRSSCTITIAFAPVTSGTRAATLTVPRSDGGTPLTASLTGTGLQGYVTLSPKSIDFGSVCVTCEAPPTTQVAVTNTGNATLTIRGITSSDPKQFPVKSRCGTALAQGQKCTFYVTFYPVANVLQQATITIDADGGGQHSLAVQGTKVPG